MNKRTFKNFVPIRLISFFTVLAFLAAMMPSAVLADDEKADYAMAVFGKETKGLPEELLAEHYESCIRIPMKEHMRSLNLSNSVAIIAYEVLRQFGFEHLKQDGELTKQH